MINTDELRAGALAALESATTVEALEQQRVALLGKKGSLTEALKTLGSVDAETRKTLGAALNALKNDVAAALDARKAVFEASELDARLQNERVDVTLPARTCPKGSIHPVSHVIEEITTLFASLGFAVEEGPDVEDDFHNFNALNIPESHPARQMHDTFYLRPDAQGQAPYLLRTHTSPVQIRTMKAGKPPFRFIAPGTTYRCDSDQTHTPMFHQVEGLVIEKNIHFGHLKGVIIDFLKAFFEISDVPVRFRPSFFPFTEPSAEVDIGCDRSGGQLKIGAGKDWLEVMGCGMVHPNVLAACGIDANEWQGFAFGMGVERLAMLKYNIPDLRTFFESDVRWLKHYGFDPLDIPSQAGGI